jgi:Calx-beta domain
MARSLTVLVITIAVFGALSVTSASALNMTGTWRLVESCQIETFSEGHGVPSSEGCKSVSGIGGTHLTQAPGSNVVLDGENPYVTELECLQGKGFPPGIDFCGTLSGNGFTYTKCSYANAQEGMTMCGGTDDEEVATVAADGKSWTGTLTIKQGGSTIYTASKNHWVRESEAEPELSITGPTVAEPTSGTGTANFTVSLSASSASAVSVEYATQNGSGRTGAGAPADFEATHGTLTFSPGETSKTIPVTVKASGLKGKHRFSMALSGPLGAGIASGEATGTIVGSSPLRVTITVPSPEVDIQQNEGGAIAQNVTATVTLKNTGAAPIENVTLPSSLTLGWHGPAPVNALPIKQVGAPATLKLGTIAPGASSRRSEYKIQIEGDGHFDIQALATGSEANETIHALGTKTIEPTSQLLVEKNTIGAEVHSQTNAGLIQAGTHFLVKVQLENRSYANRLQLEPYYAELSGNAKGGQLIAEGEPTTYSAPTGAISEINDSPAIVLEPRENRNYFVVVGTSASDAFAQKGVGGGTRATVKLEAPDVSTLDAEDTPTSAPDDRTVLTPGSEELQVGIDDSVAPPPPFDDFEAKWAVSKGVVLGLWGATWGTVRGIWDLGMLAGKGVLSIGSGALNEVGHIAELWKATEGNPAARLALAQTVVSKVYTAYKEAPWLLGKAAVEAGVSLSTAIPKLVEAYFTKITNEWYAGDWRQAITDMSETGTNAVALLAGPGLIKAAGVGPAALRVASGSLARLAPVAEALSEESAALYAKAGAALDAVSEAIEPAATAVKALAEGVPGYEFTVAQLRKFVGMSADEAEWLSKFTAERKISVVLRSRAEESIEWIKKGAMLKPSWVKSKNVTWLDREFLGYSEKDIGRVVMKKMPPLGELQAKLAAKGLAEGTPEYENVILRWQERNSTYAKEIKQMKAWNNADTIKGKWPWQESGVDPSVQADEIKAYKFRLRPDAHDPEALVPEVFNPVTKRFGSITGDIDLVAVTKADGSSFTQEEYVKVLKELADSPLGVQHPDSTVWVKDGEFWFDKKKDYLASDGNVQFGPDGKARSVAFDELHSEPESWSQFAYRIIWKGGYQVGPGQVP